MTVDVAAAVAPPKRGSALPKALSVDEVTRLIEAIPVGEAAEIADVINAVSAALTPEGLVELNVESVEDQRSSADIAKDWIAANL